MPIQIGRGPDHGFDEPLGLLSDCHRRIEHFLRVLVLVSVDAGEAGGPLPPAHHVALEGALRYFATAAKTHTADEEVSLFPRLRETAAAAGTEALAALDRLEEDHDAAEADHTAVDLLVRQWLADERLPPPAAAELRNRLSRLQALYGRHITVEDQELFPAAARALDAAQIREIGREMAERRKLRAPGGGDAGL